MNNKILNKKRLGLDPVFIRLLGMIILVVAVMTALRPGQFLTLRSLSAMTLQFPEYGIMALGLMPIMITGGIDLSCVGIANLTGIICALLLRNSALAGAGGPLAGLTFLGVICVGLIVGFVCGSLNAFFVHKLHIPPIMTTIGTMLLFTGIGLVITGGKALSGLPAIVSDVVSFRLFGVIPFQLLVFIVLTAILALIMRKTSLGVSIYLMGSNEKSAQYAGLNNGKIRWKIYALSGVYSAIAGLIMLITLNSAKADYGSSYQLLTILICVLGGVNPTGGKGTVGGVVLAIITMQLIASGMNMFSSLSIFYRNLVWGIVLLGIMVSNYYFDKKHLQKGE